MSILFLVPARGGSKRLPSKNLKKLAGIPLVAHAIRRAQGAARLLGSEHRIVCSTDSEEIAQVARDWGAEVLMRPAELATDRAESYCVEYHALETLGRHFESVVLVQPTSPLALPEDMVAAILASREIAWPVYSVSERHEEEANGAVYVEPLVRGVARGNSLTVMPDSRSIDIDTQDDWDMAEALLAARKPAPFAIGDRQIGPGHPCFVIAEAGVNHNGNVSDALHLVDAAAEARADAVKFQAFIPEQLAEPGPHRDMLAGLILPRGVWPLLKARAESRGLIFLASAFEVESVDMLDVLDVPAFKVPSGEIINLPLLRHIASKGKPVILSTGMSTMVEVARAVDALHGVPLALLHCESRYPAFPQEANLKAMDTLRQAFGVPVGLSDHTFGKLMPHAAAARGGSIIEKHLSLDLNAPGPDQLTSILPQELRFMVADIRLIEQSMGSGEKVPTRGELETAKTARRRDGLRRNAS